MCRMKNNLSTIFEVIWFVFGGLLLFIGVDISLDTGLADSWYYFLLAILAFLMYARRRKMRMNSPR